MKHFCAHHLHATRLAPGDFSVLASALEAAALPAGDLDLPGRIFLRFADAHGGVVGHGGYERHGGAALLRSIVVLPGLRGQGYGRAVVDRLMEDVAAGGATMAYLLTENAAGFFEALGFVAFDRAAAPKDILGTEQARRLCPASARLLRKPIAR